MAISTGTLDLLDPTATSVVVASTEFQSLGKAECKTLGISDLRFAIIPHPFGALKRHVGKVTLLMPGSR